MLPVQVVTTATKGTAPEPWNCTCVVLGTMLLLLPGVGSQDERWVPGQWDLGWESLAQPGDDARSDSHTADQLSQHLSPTSDPATAWGDCGTHLCP